MSNPSDSASERYTSARLDGSHLPYRHRQNATKQKLDDPRQVPWSGSALGLLACVKEGGVGIVCGRRGTGKTQMVTSVAMQYDQEIFKMDPYAYGRADMPTCLYYTAFSLLVAIRNHFQTKGDERRSFDRALATAPLLIIDEFGERSGSEWEGAQLCHVVDQRYQSMLPTVIALNCGAEDIQKAVSPSILSRCQEGGLLVHCDWESFRERSAQ